MKFKLPESKEKKIDEGKTPMINDQAQSKDDEAQRNNSKFQSTNKSKDQQQMEVAKMSTVLKVSQTVVNEPSSGRVEETNVVEQEKCDEHPVSGLGKRASSSEENSIAKQPRLSYAEFMKTRPSLTLTKPKAKQVTFADSKPSSNYRVDMEAKVSN